MLWKMKETVITSVIGALGTITKCLVGGGVERRSWESDDETGPSKLQNAEKSPRDLRRLAVPQIPVNTIS